MIAVIVPEMNTGQLETVLRDQYLVDAQPVNKVSGQPFTIAEIEAAIEEALAVNEMTTIARTTTLKDWETDQEVRWCPGCGDYAILKAVQRHDARNRHRARKHGFRQRHRLLVALPLLYGNLRLPHDPRPRAGIRDGAEARQSGPRHRGLSTGDGDGLSIGGNHTMHLIRRNLDCQIMLFNNEIDGLTKGQYSPTSRVGDDQARRRPMARSTARRSRGVRARRRARASLRAASTCRRNCRTC